MIYIDKIEDKKILIIDDEQSLLDLMEDVLKREGFKHIYTENNGIDGILKCKEINPDIVLLDVMLPDIDGFKTCEKIREFSKVPIIFLSAKSDNIDKLMGLSIGGDDYVTKPFNTAELILRVKSQLRRSSYTNLKDEVKELSFGEIVINESRGEVLKGGFELEMTAKEYQMILFFAKNPNQIFSKGKLCEQVWGYDYEGYDNTIMVHIRHLREKIEDNPSKPKYIKTIKGLGYKLVVNNR